MSRLILPPALLLCFCLTAANAAEDDALRGQAAASLKKASEFFRTRVSTEGGYLWRYSEDLKRRQGEGRADDQTVWVQPPGTPSVGMAFLEAYRNTGDEYYLDAARQAGYCLLKGQLRSGGWSYSIRFDAKRRQSHAYRVDEPVEGKKQRNTSTLDDNTTQAALRLLMRLDQTLEFKDAKIHEAVEYAFDALLAAQYPIGAWPQRFDAPVDPDKFPVMKAGYPESWSRTHPRDNYSGFYTFNDNAISDVIDVMFEAYHTYGKRVYEASAEKAGGFILLAQMPEPQPAWAQQYNTQMQPAWARRFEPPSITGGESQGVMRTLLQLYSQTGERKYLEPIPRAIAYLRRSLLPDGKLARFYELKTNKPLYFTIDYKLTYSDADMPTHYSFQGASSLDSIERAYERLSKLDPTKLAAARSTRQSAKPKRKASKRQLATVKAVIAALDQQGRWVQDGDMKKYLGADDDTTRVIDCRAFINNISTLSRFLATAE